MESAASRSTRPLAAGVSLLRIIVTGAAFFAAALAGTAQASSGFFGSAGASGAPRLEPDPRAAAFAAAPERLPWETALDLALWASGAEGPALDSARGAARTLVADFLASLPAAAPDAAKAEAALSFLHRTALKSYSERQTRLDVLLSGGRFNCVSSAALYLVFATAAGLDVRGVSAPDHAFCSVLVDGGSVDVETTNPYGYDPGTRKEFHDSFGRVTGFAYANPRDYRSRRELGGKALLSLILTNRVADLEAAGRYAEAVGLAVDRAALLPGDPEVRNDLLGRLLNHAASLAKAGREAEGLAWAERARAAYGDDPKWVEFEASAANNLVVRLARRGAWAEARAALARLGSRLSPAARAELAASLADGELSAAASAASTAESAEAVLRAIEAASERGELAPVRARELGTHAALREASRLSRAEGHEAAAKYLEGLSFAPGLLPAADAAALTYRANRKAELHNAFARLFNAGRWEEAREAAAAAVRAYPDDARLARDLATAEKAIAEK